MTAEREPITDAGRALSRDERGAIHREMVFWIGHQWHNEGGIASEYVRDNLVAYSDAVAIEARALGAAEERERLRERAEPRWHLGHGNDFATCIWPRCIEIRWLLADPEEAR